jgi:hypothetical protein
VRAALAEQGRENDSSSLVDRAVMDLLYPTGGYSAETGGKMKNIRELTVAQVQLTPNSAVQLTLNSAVPARY